MTEWQSDKRWADRFMDEIKFILGFYLIGPANEEEDQFRNTDLVVLKMNAIRIACRIRRNEFFQKYPNEFTIRAGRPSGAKTELAKIIEGWGDYMFYGFTNQRETSLEAWILGDLAAFRGWYTRAVIQNKGQLPGSFHANPDNSSSFFAFDLHDMPEHFIIGAKNTAACPQQ